MQKIVTNLWFDGRVEEALDLYTSLLPDSRVTRVQRYGEGGMGKPGDIFTANFELAGQLFTIINGNSYCEHSAAISLMVRCVDQDEVDRLWEGLICGGGRAKPLWLAYRPIRRLLADYTDQVNGDDE